MASTNALSTIITGSTNATVAIWYDQSGNSIHVLSSSSTATIITAGTINTLFGQPTVYFSGSTSLLTSSSTVDYSAQSGATVNVVAQNVSTTASVGGIIGAAYAIGNPGYNISYGANGVGYQSDGAGCQPGTNLSSTSPQIVTNIFVNTTTNQSNTYVNGVLKTNSGSTCSLTHTSGSRIYMGSARGYAAFSFIGNISEAIIFPKQLADAERNPLEANQTQTYFSPSVTITSSASGAVCAGTSITFTANAYNFTSTVNYQWFKNAAAISGATSATYSSTALSNNDQVYVTATPGYTAGSISSTNLIANFDAANYNPTSTRWNDLSTSGNHMDFYTSFAYTTLKTATYSSEGGGSLNVNNNSVYGRTINNTGISGNGGKTMSAWIKFDAANSDWTDIANFGSFAGWAQLFEMFGSRNGSGYQIMLVYSGSVVAGATIIPQNTWTYVTISADGPSLKVYVNGNLDGSATQTLSTVNSPLYLGNPSSTSNFDNLRGKIATLSVYNAALTSQTVLDNYNATKGRYTASAGYTSNTITSTVNASPTTPIITTNGDACVNKTSLTTPTGLTSYAWYKDNVSISGATSSTYTPTASGVYQVTVSNGTCTNTSAATTIYSCGKTAEGKMSPITSSTTLVTIAGEINSKYGVDERGLMLTKPFANIPTGTNPVTTGLILYLDATRPASYSGTGNTWADISGLSPAGSATLVGSPVFGSGSTTNGSGSFTFGSNINASTTKTYTIDNEITYIAWVNPSTNFDGGVIVRRTDPSFNSGATSLYLYNNNLGYDWDNQNWGWRSNLTVPNNQWSMIVITVNSSTVTAYMCNASGIASASSGRGHSSLTSKGATNFYIAYDPYSPTGRALNGKMGTAMVYSVALSSADISSIFNAQKASFGL